MNLLTRIRISLIFSAALLLSTTQGCTNKKDDKDRDPAPGIFSPEKGFGNSLEAPQGVPFKLPDGITLATGIKGYLQTLPDSCGGVTWEHLKSSGVLMAICVGLKNTSNQPINVTMPPGLIVVSESVKVQNGILTERLNIEVPANQVLFTPIGLYCLNGSRTPGNSPALKFKFGPVTTNKVMLDFFELLKTKNTRPKSAPNPLYAAYIQSCIWELANDGKMDPVTLENFNRIPDK